jgi:hypothetical protein
VPSLPHSIDPVIARPYSKRASLRPVPVLARSHRQAAEALFRGRCVEWRRG